MLADVVFLPRDLENEDLHERSVVVFDVLRATTSMAAALAAGVSEIRIFGSTQDAAQAAAGFEGARLLCGEERCLPPAGFDLGNSPNAFKADSHRGKTMFMSTTNGTRVAKRLVELGLDITLLCAGTGGHFALEDLIGTGAVLDAVQSIAAVQLKSDRARLALRVFQDSRERLRDEADHRRNCDGRHNRSAVGVPRRLQL